MSVIDAETIQDVLVEYAGAYVIILFGSRRNGRARPDSDVDIAFLGDRTVGGYERFMIAQELAGRLAADVDLVDLSTASTVLRAQIITGGTVMYCSDERRRMEFFMKALKEYARLNEERAVILRAIERRGSIYGS